LNLLAEKKADSQWPSAIGLPQIREATFDDYAEIADLQQRCRLFPIKSFEDWRHLWAANPAYLRQTSKLPIGWVLDLDGTGVVGYLGNIPLWYDIAGRRYLAAAGHSWVVDERFRAFSPLLVERYLSQTAVELFMIATVNHAASQCLSMFNIARAPVGAWDETSFWITAPRNFAEHWSQTKGIPCSKPLSWALAPVVSIANLAAVQKLKHQLPGCRVSVRDTVDREFDDFWYALTSAKPNVLRAVRTTGVLEWHYSPAFRAGSAWFVTVHRGSSMVAYGSFFRHDNDALGLKRVRLVDFQALDDDLELLEVVLSCALKKCRDDGIDMLESIGFCERTRCRISRVAGFHRQLPSWLYYYQVQDIQLGELLKDSMVWDPSQYDGDASL